MGTIAFLLSTAARVCCLLIIHDKHYLAACVLNLKAPRREFSNLTMGVVNIIFSLFGLSLPYLDVTMFRSGFRCPTELHAPSTISLDGLLFQPRVHNSLQRVSNANSHCRNTLRKVM